MPLEVAPEKQRQENLELKASLGYIERPYLTRQEEWGKRQKFDQAGSWRTRMDQGVVPVPRFCVICSVPGYFGESSSI